jgi:hypothetical protein
VSFCGLTADQQGPTPIDGGTQQGSMEDWQSRLERGSQGVHGLVDDVVLRPDCYVGAKML